MLNIYKSSYKYGDMVIMDSMMLTCSWLKFVDMALFKMCVVVCMYV